MRDSNGALFTALLPFVLLVFPGCGNSGNGSPPSEPEGKILLIVVDTLRADALGCYGYDRPTSPNIDRLAASGRVFRQARAQSPWTLPSLATILTGFYPRQHGAVRSRRDFYALPEAAVTLPEILGDRGFATGAFVNTQFGFPPYRIDQGFDDYSVEKGVMSSDIRDASTTAGLAAAWIERHAADNFLLLVHLFDPHLVYEAPPEFRERFVTDPGYEGKFNSDWGNHHDLDALFSGRDRPAMRDRRHLRDLYDAEIAYADEAVGTLLDKLEDSGIRDETLVILTADHGEEFWDHGGFEHGHSFYDEVIRIPLILSQPGRIEPGTTSTASVGQIDIFPTVLAATGAKIPDDLPGVSLFDVDDADTHSRVLVSESPLKGTGLAAYVLDHTKLISTAGRPPVITSPWADPREGRDLLSQQPDLVSRYRDEVERLNGRLAVNVLPRTKAEENPINLDDELKETLERQGYLR